MNNKQPDFKDKINKKIKRKIAAQNETQRSTLSWLGVFGLIGWGVSTPLLAGIFLGRLADKYWAYEQVSWTLTGLIVGLVIGCFNAWYWVTKERR